MFRITYNTSHFELDKKMSYELQVLLLRKLLHGSSCVRVLPRTLAPKVLCCRLKKVDLAFEVENWFEIIYFTLIRNFLLVF